MIDFPTFHYFKLRIMFRNLRYSGLLEKMFDSFFFIHFSRYPKNQPTILPFLILAGIDLWGDKPMSDIIELKRWNLNNPEFQRWKNPSASGQDQQVHADESCGGKKKGGKYQRQGSRRLKLKGGSYDLRSVLIMDCRQYAHIWRNLNQNWLGGNVVCGIK